MNTSYDALVDLLESIERFLRRLDIYTQIPHNLALDEMVIKIMVELLATLALVSKELKQGRSREYVLVDMFVILFNVTQKFSERSFFGENHIEAVLHRLDRLTQDEAQTTAAEILKVVHGLVRNMNVVTDGEQTRSASSTIC
jgi:hypothetical protein